MVGKFVLLPALVLAAACACAETNLIANGAFEQGDGKPPAAFRCGNTGGMDGRFELFTEDSTWNRCGKLIAGSLHEEPAGGRRVDVHSGLVKVGAAVEPDTMYSFSIDLKGTVDCVHFGLTEFRKADGREIRKGRSLGTFPVGADWRNFRGTFRTQPGATRIDLSFHLWTEVPKGRKGGFSEGDYALIDNVTLVKAERQSRLIEALKTTKAKTLVAPIPVETDPACPFLPLELAEAPTQIVFRAAVNEKKPLPVAIGNMTAAFMQYRVVLETEPKRQPGLGVVPDDGAFGLEGFPAEKITVREALRFKDTNREPVTSRLDPLVGMNEMSVLSVPPREAGVVWFDFDTTGVKPGVYRGRLRVIPLVAAAAYAVRGSRHVRVRSDEVFLPVAFTVDPIELPRESVRPAHLCSPCESEEAFRLEADVGMRIFALATDLFSTNFIGRAESPFHRTVAKYRTWARNRGVEPLFFIKYDAWGAAQRLYNPKREPARNAAAWETYVHAVARLMGEAGIPFSDYYVLVKDEPQNAALGMVREAQEALKRLYPQMRTYVSVGHGIDGPVDYIDALGPSTDIWAAGHRIFGEAGTLKRLHALQAARGAKILHYACATSPRADLAGYFRAHAWCGECWQTDADMLYQFEIYNPGGRGAWSLKVAPEGEIAYLVGGKFFPSVRYMAYREGVTDIKYLAALRAKRGGEESVRKFLREAAEEVVRYRNIPDLPARMREKARALLLSRTNFSF